MTHCRGLYVTDPLLGPACNLFGVGEVAQTTNQIGPFLAERSIK